MIEKSEIRSRRIKYRQEIWPHRRYWAKMRINELR
jgi:hypothetical protein